MSPNKHSLPATGWNGLIKHWRNDLIAAFSVALVALPLSLGIAVASGVEPMSGIIAAVIGGFVTTFFRGAYTAINGPGAGLIAVVIAATMSLDDGSGRAINYMLAAVAVSGAIQLLLGVFRLGKLANIFPSSVIHGMLAAIGIIIFSKQIHVALGTHSDATTSIGILSDVITELPNINPFIAVISLASLLLLIFHARISYKLFHFLPAPIWVLIIAVPFVYIFNFLEPHQLNFLGQSYEVGPQMLVNIPANPLDAIIYPDFSKISTGPFWLAVFSITLISSIETLAIAKAIDKLDPYKRVTDSNKDLIGNGLGTMVSGFLGGLPIIPLIARSSVNIQNNAKTGWSNLYNSIFILLFVVLLGPMIQKVPLAALAAILVYTGYKLAAPRVFRLAYEQGMEQLLFIFATVIITLYSDLLWGIFGGIALTLLVHLLLSRLPVDVFFKMIFRSNNNLIQLPDQRYRLEINGVANFLSILKINNLLDKIPAHSSCIIDLSEAHLVDLTVQERLEDFKRRHEENNGQVDIVGLEGHISSTTHPWALKSLIQATPLRLTPREQRFQDLAQKHDWNHQLVADQETSYLQNFQFFETRPIERKSNVISGTYTKKNIRWVISDITFDEGALMATEVYNTTVQIIHLPQAIPKFILEKEHFLDKVFDRVMEMSGQRDIDFQLFTKFSKKFLLKGADESAIRSFFTPQLIEFLERKDIYHIESNGEALLLFKYLRPAKAEEVTTMLSFSRRLLAVMK
jgi:MFS superfamily sulfate permease-like transporter